MNVWMILKEPLWQALRQKHQITMRTLDDVARYDPEMHEEINFYESVAKEEPMAGRCPDVDPYFWLATQMQQRITGQRGEWAYPWTGYWQFSPESMKPDMRSVRHWWPEGEREDPHYLVQLDIPSDKLILYDDEAWIAAMNQHAVTLCQSEYDTFYGNSETGAYREDINCDSVRETWPRMFDIDFLVRTADPEWARYGERIMAAFITLDIDYVRHVRRYPKVTLNLLGDAPQSMPPSTAVRSKSLAK